MPALFLLSGPSAGLRYEVRGEAVLGRSPSCEIPLEDAKVSRRHAKVVVRDGQARITDLNSRNGTIVNGDKVEGEAILLPGDRVQVGDSTILFEPPAKASLTDRESGELTSFVLEEVLPAVGPAAAFYSTGTALLSATSEAMVLRRVSEELARAVNAEKAAALLGGTDGLLTAAVVGAESVEVPRALAKLVLERREVTREGGNLCAPLTASGGPPFGILFAERPEAFGNEELKIAAALGRLGGEALTVVRSRVEGDPQPVTLVGSSRQFRKTLEQARRAAAGVEPVVLYGERGTGKALTAEYIHSRSARALGPFVVADCRRSAVAVEEDLFGRQSAPGLPPLSSALLRADGGTLLLKNIDLLQRHSAEKLGRFLGRRVAPARAGGEEPVDVRLIATAASALGGLAARGELDTDLVKALSGTDIEVLALRERRTDVPQLFEVFAGRVARAVRKEPPTLSPEARRLLVEYEWPGNVRELRLVAERLAMLYPSLEIPALKLPPEVQEGAASTKARTLTEMIARLERDAIAEALREAKGKKIRAAALLGISRPTLDKKIADYQLSVERVRKA